ncbi:MAG: hypothetical protein K0U19_06025 [Proteobacteria bacterium]|nr:hypothetical protein [Pseudomonadota bacterium]
MAGKTHPYLQTAYTSALVFFALVFIIVFIALYVHSSVYSEPNLAPEVIEQNLTPPGKIYPRQ